MYRTTTVLSREKLPKCNYSCRCQTVIVSTENNANRMPNLNLRLFLSLALASRTGGLGLGLKHDVLEPIPAINTYYG